MVNQSGSCCSCSGINGDDLASDSCGSAAQGVADAQVNLGVMYATGRGVPQDAAEAVRWYRLATDQGDAQGQFNLGVMYADGRGVPQDDAEAVHLYRLAAEQENVNAIIGLGGAYELGQGVP